MSDTRTIYKICTRHSWDAALAALSYTGSADDLRDGFIHFSTAEQLAGTAAKHFRNQTGLVLLAVETSLLGNALRWEPSRGGELFPHLYAPLTTSSARLVADLPLGADGVPMLPQDLDQ